MFMKKFLGITLALFLLQIVITIPALGYTTYSTNKYYSTKYNSNYSSFRNYYSTKYKYYRFTIKTPTSSPSTTPAPTPAPTPTPTPAPTPSTPASGSLAAEESKMVSLVNQARLSQGISPLAVNATLTSLARQKSADMIANNYFSHTSPTYGSPFDMMRQAGVSYRTAGENIARASTTESAHSALMNSPGHRANILNANYHQIGIGIAAGSGVYGNAFTQMFIGF